MNESASPSAAVHSSNGKGQQSTAPVTEGPAPHIRLSQPGSSSVRVIPPLRGLERRYCCAWCGGDLFSLANVVRVDLLAADRERGAGAGDEVAEAAAAAADA